MFVEAALEVEVLGVVEGILVLELTTFMLALLVILELVLDVLRLLELVLADLAVVLVILLFVLAPFVDDVGLAEIATLCVSVTVTVETPIMLVSRYM